MLNYVQFFRPIRDPKLKFRKNKSKQSDFKNHFTGRN